MRLMLLAVGRMKAGPERLLLSRYVERAAPLARTLGFTGFTLHEIEESRARQAAQRKQDEARTLAAAMPGGSTLFCLDEHGTPLSSADFATALAKVRDGGGPALTMVIGGPDGLDPAFGAGAGQRIAYGRATFPHQLVRVMAAEQIYRALTILAGHPYHRA